MIVTVGTSETFQMSRSLVVVPNTHPPSYRRLQWSFFGAIHRTPGHLRHGGRMIRLQVKELAEARGFNQSSLSRASDVSFLTIKRIFRDPHKDVAMSTLEKLARALGVRVADLFEEISDDDKQA